MNYIIILVSMFWGHPKQLDPWGIPLCYWAQIAEGDNAPNDPDVYNRLHRLHRLSYITHVTIFFFPFFVFGSFGVDHVLILPEPMPLPRASRNAGLLICCIDFEFPVFAISTDKAVHWLGSGKRRWLCGIVGEMLLLCTPLSRPRGVYILPYR